MAQHYRASDLVKDTCKKIVYCTRNNIKKEVTEWMIRGVDYQHSVVEEYIKRGGEVYEEMAGTCEIAGVAVDFSVDMIENGSFFEIKSVFDENDFGQWYLNLSLLQCAFYKTLLLNMSEKVLQTAFFRIDDTHPMVTLKVDAAMPYRLIFGNVGVYDVEVTDPAKILEFFSNKIKHLVSYDAAMEFDAVYKHQEFNTLKGYFTYKKI